MYTMKLIADDPPKPRPRFHVHARSLASFCFVWNGLSIYAYVSIRTASYSLVSPIIELVPEMGSVPARSHYRDIQPSTQP